MTRAGVVETFDVDVGLGRLRADEAGQALFPFHCTQIADGSRSIEVGTRVTFTVVPGRGGRWEAAMVTPR
ncbi:MAG: cold shock domain-containing protein [Acidimicrobiales bacterium]